MTTVPLGVDAVAEKEPKDKTQQELILVVLYALQKGQKGQNLCHFQHFAAAVVVAVVVVVVAVLVAVPIRLYSKTYLQELQLFVCKSQSL